MSKFVLMLVILLSTNCNQPEPTKVIETGIPPIIPGGRVVLPPNPNPVPGFVTFEQFEQDNLVAVNSLPQAEQFNTRIISLCDKYNEGESIEDARGAVVKALNAISLERQVGNGQWVGESRCAFVFDQRRFSLTPGKWRAIERAEPLQFESFTTRGILLKQLTQTRRPWIQGDTFIQTVLAAGPTADPNINDLYYNLLGIPNNEADFLSVFLGCDIQQLFDDEDSERLFMAGIRNSAIALGKSRSWWFAECREGFASGTYDTLNLGGVGRNLSVNPFPIEARTDNTFQHDGREVIGRLPNGWPVYWLSDGDGNRQSVAPVNLVADNKRANINPEIAVGFSCDGCHNNLFIDNGNNFIAAAIRGNPIFDARERQLGEFLFNRVDGLRARMREATSDHARVMNTINVDANQEDPMNGLTDQIRIEMDLRQVASKFHMDPQEFANLLPSSAGGRAIIGQLIDDNPINFDELIDSLNFIIVDLNLFQDPIGGFAPTPDSYDSHLTYDDLVKNDAVAQ